MRRLFAIGGLVALTAGAYMAWPPAAYMVAGLVLLVLAVADVMTEQRDAT